MSLAACNTETWQVKRCLTWVFCVCMRVLFLCVLVPMYPDLCVGHADGVVSSQNRSSAAEVRFVKIMHLGECAFAFACVCVRSCRCSGTCVYRHLKQTV